LVDLVNGGEKEGGGKGFGAPSASDWRNIEKNAVFLKHFYHLTIRISGSFYVTANTFFHEIINVECLLRNLRASNDVELSAMTNKMTGKYEKYWGNIEKVNSLIYVAVILDPRHKLEFVEFTLVNLYGEEKGKKMIKKVNDDLTLLFDEYKILHGSIINDQGGRSKQRKIAPVVEDIGVLTSMFKKHKSATNGGESKSELEKYLMDDLEVVDETCFDILQWWKVNSPRFPILSYMVCDVLAVPISTVASESTFSTGGRILDAFRSSLTPKIVQSLICTEDWLRSTNLVSVKENLEILDQLEEGKKLIYALQLHFQFSSIVIIFIIIIHLQNF
jgi:hAT family C-terminal dimerisation region/Domain of unknown function (DUF4413)